MNAMGETWVIFGDVSKVGSLQAKFRRLLLILNGIFDTPPCMICMMLTSAYWQLCIMNISLIID